MKRTLLLLLLWTGSALAEEPADLVWPWLDSANSRWFFFNSATRPFGMVNLSPDTDLEGAWGSGYRYNTHEVKALSHVHAWQLSGLPVLPVSATGGVDELLEDHYSPFSHETEVVKPGYHRLVLERYGIEVELTATTRVGFHRYSYRARFPRQLLIPLGGMLGPVEIGSTELRQSGPHEQRVRFYTDLFHALQGRRIISDVDGRYADQTGPQRVIRQLPLDVQGKPRFNHHNSDSFWGAQWTIQTLWPLAYPRIASDFAQSLMTYYRDGGLVPRGPSGGNYTYVMTGASSTPFLVSNWMKGIKNMDVGELYQALRKNHLPGGIMGRAGYEHHSNAGGGLRHYIKNGYVPYPLPEEVEAYHLDGAGQTLEYAYQDWTLAQLATSLGKSDDAALLLDRSRNYKKLYDTDTGFMRPRLENGDWYAPFDPHEYRTGFVESNAAQCTWYVPHDYAGLSALMGGDRELVRRLDLAFNVAQKQGFTSGKSHDRENRERNRRIPINYGNQPSIQTAFIFNVVGAPWLTQKWSREVVEAVYSRVSPNDGYNGDEDQGLMGSLAVLMKIGLFQLDGGASADPVYQLGSPLFDRITIQTDPDFYSGKPFVIEVKNNSTANRYIQSMSLNGQPLSRYYLYHREIVSGGRLELRMGPEPINGLPGLPATPD